MTDQLQDSAGSSITLEAIAVQIAELKDLYVRRLYEDKNTKQLMHILDSSLQKRDAVETGNAFAPLMKELLLAVDRLRTNADGSDLVQSVGDEIMVILERYGVTAIGNEGIVDAKVHDVVKTRCIEGVAAGTIVEVVRPGFMLGNRVLRPSQVIIAQ